MLPKSKRTAVLEKQPYHRILEQDVGTKSAQCFPSHLLHGGLKLVDDGTPATMNHKNLIT